MSDNDYRKHVLDFYNRMAGFYDLIEFVRRGTRTRVLELSDFKAGDKVLDVCTGTGELALAFASQGATVVGIDLSRGMLDRAAKKNGYRNSTWLEMDATQLEFQDKTFDISTISLALHHMPEATQCHVLSEMVRVTRRQVVIVEHHTPSNPKLWTAWATIASWLDESEYLSDWVRQDLSKTCRSAGLRVKEQTVMTFGLHHIVLCTLDGKEVYR